MPKILLNITRIRRRWRENLSQAVSRVVREAWVTFQRLTETYLRWWLQRSETTRRPTCDQNIHHLRFRGFRAGRDKRQRERLPFQGQFWLLWLQLANQIAGAARETRIQSAVPDTRGNSPSHTERKVIRNKKFERKI